MKISNLTDNLKYLSYLLMLSALAWSIWAGFYIWTSPIVYSGVRYEFTETGQTVTEVTETKSFSEVSDAGYIPLIIPPALIIFLILALHFSRLIVMTFINFLFAGYWFITGFSIGGAYTLSLVLIFAGLAVAIISRNLKNA